MPRIRTAHKLSERQRTGDVLTDELVDFKSLLLSPDVLKGLNSSGFERPSPIQLKAIPLGRCGLDLISQAKSGTGKTCVFSVIALESLSLDSNTTQVLILAPTREIAVQIREVITSIGSQMDSLVCHVFIGGLPVEDNKKMLKKPCHIAVGTPGRIKFLIENHFLKTDSVRLFILDEADKLLEDSFQEQINWIFSSLPSNKQMMAFSATYPEYLAKHLTRYMREPTFVRLNAADPTLQGIKQFYKLVPFHPLPHKTFQEKCRIRSFYAFDDSSGEISSLPASFEVSELLKLLSSLPFHQCLVFSNYQIRAQSLCDTLCLKGWPSVFIAGSQNQSQRLKAMEKLKEFKCRVLISTDLTSRGIDAEHVDLVVNMDVPRDPETYLHRIGRAGRFGTQGIAVTFVSQREEDKLFKKMEEKIGITINTLPDPIPESLRTSEASSGLDSKPLQSRTASVEVDILTNSSTTKLANSSPELSTVATCTRPVNAGKIIGTDGKLSENDSYKKNAKIVVNQDELPLKDGTDLLPENSERHSLTAAAQKTLEAYSHCGQNEEENYGKKLLEKAQSKSDINVLHRHETDGTAVGNFQDESEVVLETNLIKANEDEMVQHQSPIPSTERSARLVNENEHILCQLQDLKLDSRPESKDFHKSALHFETNAYRERQEGDNKSTKLEDINCQTPSSPADDKQLTFESLSDEESSDSKRSEAEETFNGLERDVYNAASTEEEGDVNDQLPSVKEFERDFEKFMESVSNFDHLVEASPISSELEDELDNNDSLGSVTRDEYYTNRTSVKTSMSTNHFDVSRDSHNCKLHVRQENSSNPILHHQNTAVSDCNVHTQNHYQTGNNYGGCHKSLSAENSNSYLYPDVSNACYDGWHVHNDSYNYPDNYDNYDSHNNCYPQGGCYGANYSAQSGAYSASWQRYSVQSCGDIGSCQDNQWNTSWYNAYQRQINSIRQFVSFSRTVRF